MAHRGQAHAARRRASYLASRGLGEHHVEHGTSAMVSAEWDASTYDDVIPHRVRGTVRLDEDGEPAELADLRPDHQ